MKLLTTPHKGSGIYYDSQKYLVDHRLGFDLCRIAEEQYQRLVVQYSWWKIRFFVWIFFAEPGNIPSPTVRIGRLWHTITHYHHFCLTLTYNFPRSSAPYIKLCSCYIFSPVFFFSTFVSIFWTSDYTSLCSVSVNCSIFSALYEWSVYAYFGPSPDHSFPSFDSVDAQPSYRVYSLFRVYSWGYVFGFLTW